ncbi:hypothetical protein B7R54_14790 [Subtercola boreus]|uniref:Uncharacterized protein n=1 Tax=Subtercola boreus TaxID=120213 RepID=A0A3E0VL19_9MICO|nr:hypothetical protein [Subtercola boreus]RFA10335.1 hypothetical protein B7R54_14790 [Subtercola boreus]TQL56157.1 hypothetical protein FB464_3744 [Subtercola boreus]
MPSTPYIAFTEFLSRADRALNGWSGFREHVRSGARAMAALTGETLPRSFDPRLAPLAENAGPVSPPFTGGIWRLLALNNREIARSLFLYESASAASEHVRKLQRSSDDIEVHLIRGPVSMQHGWYATLDSVAVMSCGRWYPAAGLCHESAVYSVTALRTARVTPDVAATAARTLAARAADRAAARARSRGGVNA